MMPFNSRTWCHNNATRLVAVTTWLAINCLLFVREFEKYRTWKEFYYTFKLFGLSLSLSRASAKVICFNAAMVLLPMCKALTSSIRTLIDKHLTSTARRLLNHSVGFHMLCGYAIFVASTVHTLSHLVNFFQCHKNFDETILDVNVAPKKSMINATFFLQSVPVWSGMFMYLILATMVILSLTAVRRKRYELFWYTHHLFVPFYLLLVFHGFGGVIKYQTNINEHPPGCESSRNTSMCLSKLKFKAVAPEAWKWFLLPLVVYVIDRLLRCCRGNNEAQLTKVVSHPGDVIELVIRKKKFQAKPGQYILLQFPEVAGFEWHPFTLTKCSSQRDKDDEISIHVKLVGDWTRKMSKCLGILDENWIICNNNIPNVNLGSCFVIDIERSLKSEPERWFEPLSRPIRIKMDGPYGAASQDVTRFPIGFCIGAGIGVTPFASVLNYIRSSNYKLEGHKLRKLYFLWVCRSFDDLAWFLKLLHSTYNEMLSRDQGDFLEVQFYITRSKVLPQGSINNEEAITWAHDRLKYNRPQWQDVFEWVASKHHRERIGVFYCGPKQLSWLLKKTCQDTATNKNLFVFHSESFE